MATARTTGGMTSVGQMAVTGRQAGCRQARMHQPASVTAMSTRLRIRSETRWMPGQPPPMNTA